MFSSNNTGLLTKRFSDFRRKGFTLIELLTVIFIIGLLSAVIVVAATSARTRARDAKRIADLGSVSSALQQFYTDYRYFPNQYNTGDFAGQYLNLYTMTPPNLSSYVSSRPQDPFYSPPRSNPCTGGSPTAYAYRYQSNAAANSSNYYLWTIVEGGTITATWAGRLCPLYVLKGGEVFGTGAGTSFDPTSF